MQNDPSKVQYAGKSAYNGDIAKNYEKDRSIEEIWAVEQEWVRTWVEGLPLGGKLLDLPVGTGRFLPYTLPRCGIVYGADISNDMLKEASVRGGGADNLVLDNRDITQLAYPDNLFDHVLCWRLFHLLPLPLAERAISELARVCRGELVIQFFGVERCSWGRETVRTLKGLLPLRRREKPREGLESVPWSHIASFQYTERKVSRLFKSAHLKVVTCSTLAVYKGAPVNVYVVKREGEEKA